MLEIVQVDEHKSVQRSSGFWLTHFLVKTAQEACTVEKLGESIVICLLHKIDRALLFTVDIGYHSDYFWGSSALILKLSSLYPEPAKIAIDVFQAVFALPFFTLINKYLFNIVIKALDVVLMHLHFIKKAVWNAVCLGSETEFLIEIVWYIYGTGFEVYLKNHIIHHGNDGFVTLLAFVNAVKHGVEGRTDLAELVVGIKLQPYCCVAFIFLVYYTDYLAQRFGVCDTDKYCKCRGRDTEYDYGKFCWFEICWDITGSKNIIVIAYNAPTRLGNRCADNCFSVIFGGQCLCNGACGVKGDSIGDVIAYLTVFSNSCERFWIAYTWGNVFSCGIHQKHWGIVAVACKWYGLAYLSKVNSFNNKSYLIAHARINTLYNVKWAGVSVSGTVYMRDAVVAVCCGVKLLVSVAVGADVIDIICGKNSSAGAGDEHIRNKVIALYCVAYRVIDLPVIIIIQSKLSSFNVFFQIVAWCKFLFVKGKIMYNISDIIGFCLVNVF